MYVQAIPVFVSQVKTAELTTNYADKMLPVTF